MEGSSSSLHRDDRLDSPPGRRGYHEGAVSHEEEVLVRYPIARSQGLVNCESLEARLMQAGQLRQGLGIDGIGLGLLEL